MKGLTTTVIAPGRADLIIKARTALAALTHDERTALFQEVSLCACNTIAKVTSSLGTTGRLGMLLGAAVGAALGAGADASKDAPAPKFLCATCGATEFLHVCTGEKKA